VVSSAIHSKMAQEQEQLGMTASLLDHPYSKSTGPKKEEQAVCFRRESAAKFPCLPKGKNVCQWEKSFEPLGSGLRS
jgi:hypothetical protein